MGKYCHAVLCVLLLMSREATLYTLCGYGGRPSGNTFAHTPLKWMPCGVPVLSYACMGMCAFCASGGQGSNSGIIRSSDTVLTGQSLSLTLQRVK